MSNPYLAVEKVTESVSYRGSQLRRLPHYFPLMHIDILVDHGRTVSSVDLSSWYNL